jgi:glycosyltransferase involved in cell wall biosynthesis
VFTPSPESAVGSILGPAGTPAPATPAGLAGTLAALLDDPDRRQALADASRARAAGFDWDAIAANFLAVLGLEPKRR